MQIGGLHLCPPYPPHGSVGYGVQSLRRVPTHTGSTHWGTPLIYRHK